ncbi:MAG: dihydrodipicolinate synthase family protein, partial [Clostridia bacterium]|nr:dihydrodipicolinate synthase family protein [Clostridia bacterium]
MDRSPALLFRGSATALITPFSDGKIDFDSFANLIETNIRGGADALVVAGTTGEASTLSPEEQAALCECAVQVTGGRVPVIGGAGSSDTVHACHLARLISRTGCDGLLCVTPYYNKATPRGMELHFSAIAEASEKPIILYNVPSRTGCSLPLDVCKSLATHPNVCGIKEASGDVGFAARVMAACGNDLP